MDVVRRWRVELLLVVLLVAELASVAATRAPHEPAPLVVTGLSVAVLLGRRWQPFAAVTTAFALLTVGIVIVPRSTIPQFFGVLVTFALAGALEREREAVLAWVAGAGMLAYAAWLDPAGGGMGDFVLSLAVATVLWTAGLLVARRGRHVETVLRTVREAERERDARARQELAEERARIARELHDVVSHGLSVVVLQTLAARGLLADLPPSTGAREVDRHLDTVEETARDALAEMRRMLGLLQNLDDGEGGEGSAQPPAPGVRQIEDLVERLGPDAARVRLAVRDHLDLPPGLDLAVYRIVQEALTNVLKHAPGADAVVDVAEAAGSVTVTVTNGPGRSLAAQSPVGAGHGLLGIRERVALYGGSMCAGPTDDGGFQVQAGLPLGAVPLEVLPSDRVAG